MSKSLGLLRLTAMLLLGLCRPANAFDYSLSGFGSIGFAINDQPIAYLRHIDDSGTFRSDSLLGLQLEARLTPQFSATVQMVASAARDKDTGAEAAFRWAFLSYRLTDEWLVRVGRLRPPVLLNSQTGEVGVTYDQARLPVEVYSLSPVYDVDGAAVTKVWSTDTVEYGLDGYLGNTRIKFRDPRTLDSLYTKSRGAYIPERIRLTGIVLSVATESATLKLGMHRVNVWPYGNRPARDELFQIPVPGAPPVGGTLFVPGNIIQQVDINVVTLGGDWRFGNWRMLAEYGERDVRDSTIGIG